MKKLLSIALCIVITMSVCNVSILAFVPTDYDDPNCIDIRDLGVKTDYITKKIKYVDAKHVELMHLHSTDWNHMSKNLEMRQFHLMIPIV